jgi:hypothetical protein
MATAELSRRVEKVVGYPPLAELSDLQRREFHEALLEGRQLRGSTRQVSGSRRFSKRSTTGRSCGSSTATSSVIRLASPHAGRLDGGPVKRKFPIAHPFHALRGRATSGPATTRLVSRCETKNERYSCASWRDGFSQHRRRPTVTSCSNARGCGSSKSRHTRSSTRRRRFHRSPGDPSEALFEKVGGGSGRTACVAGARWP